MIINYIINFISFPLSPTFWPAPGPATAVFQFPYDWHFHVDGHALNGNVNFAFALQCPSLTSHLAGMILAGCPSSWLSPGCRCLSLPPCWTTAVSVADLLMAVSPMFSYFPVSPMSPYSPVSLKSPYSLVSPRSPCSPVCPSLMVSAHLGYHHVWSRCYKNKNL